MELKGKKINFLGDSITEGVGTSDVKLGFCNLIAQKTGAAVRNFGISGTRIARQKIPSEDPRFDLDFCSRVEEMDADADIIMIFGGTNDYGHGDAPLGNPSDRTPDTFYGALHTLYISLIEKYPRSRIAVMTPMHRLDEDNPKKGGGEGTDNLILKDYVEIIRQVAEIYSLPVLDIYKSSGLQPKVPVMQQLYVPDGLHPNDAGNEILANLIIAFLKSL